MKNFSSGIFDDDDDDAMWWCCLFFSIKGRERGGIL